MKMFLSYLSKITKRPFLLFVLIAIIFGASYPVMDIQVANRPEDWFSKKSKQLQYKAEFEELFGNDEIMLLALSFPDTAVQTTKEKQILVLKENIANVKSIKHCFARTDIADLSGLINRKKYRKLDSAYFAANNPNIEVLYLTLNVLKDPDLQRPLIIDSLNQLAIQQVPQTTKTDLTGSGVIFSEINRITTEDSSLLFLTSFLLILGLLFWQLKSFKRAILAGSLVLISLLPSLALFGWLDIPINMITLIAPLLLVINMFSFSLHLITKEENEVQAYLRAKIPPILISALATIIGFGSLMLSSIEVIYQFGLLTALGVGVGITVLLLVGTPMVLILKTKIKPRKTAARKFRFVEHYYQKLTIKSSFVLVAGLTMLFGLSIYYIKDIKVDTDSLNFLNEENSVRLAKENIENNFGAITAVNFLVRKKDSSKFRSKDWRKIKKLSRSIESLPFVDKSIDYSLWKSAVSRLNFVDPEQSDKIKKRFIADNGKASKFSVRIQSGTVREMEEMLLKINSTILKNENSKNYEIVAVGVLPAYIEQIGIIVREMLKSLSIAVLLILVVMSVFIWDIKLGLIATGVTVFPLFGVLIVMWLLDIYFDIATSMIFCIVVGMIADDVLHIIWNYKNELRKNKALPNTQLFANSVRKILHPCSSTSIMFVIGFSVLILSEISFISNFGILASSAIILAWISDFLFFPAILTLLGRNKQKNELAPKIQSLLG